MGPEIESFPKDREEINQNKLKFLSQSFFQWLSSLPQIYHTEEVFRQVRPIFEEINSLGYSAAIVTDERINRVEKRIQEFMDSYKAGIMEAHNMPSGIRSDYRVYGNEVYAASFDLMGYLEQIKINESIKKSRYRSAPVKAQAEELSEFFERFFAQVESNIPISRDVKYLEQVQKAIKLILDYSQQNEIFEKNSIQRLADFRSSIQ